MWRRILRYQVPIAAVGPWVAALLIGHLMAAGCPEPPWGFSPRDWSTFAIAAVALAVVFERDEERRLGVAIGRGALVALPFLALWAWAPQLPSEALWRFGGLFLCGAVVVGGGRLRTVVAAGLLLPAMGLAYAAFHRIPRGESSVPFVLTSLGSHIEQAPIAVASCIAGVVALGIAWVDAGRPATPERWLIGAFSVACAGLTIIEALGWRAAAVLQRAEGGSVDGASLSPLSLGALWVERVTVAAVAFLLVVAWAAANGAVRSARARAPASARLRPMVPFAAMFLLAWAVERVPAAVYTQDLVTSVEVPRVEGWTLVGQVPEPTGARIVVPRDRTPFVVHRDGRYVAPEWPVELSDQTEHRTLIFVDRAARFGRLAEVLDSLPAIAPGYHVVVGWSPPLDGEVPSASRRWTFVGGLDPAHRAVAVIRAIDTPVAARAALERVDPGAASCLLDGAADASVQEVLGSLPPECKSFAYASTHTGTEPLAPPVTAVPQVRRVLGSAPPIALWVLLGLALGLVAIAQLVAAQLAELRTARPLEGPPGDGLPVHPGWVCADEATHGWGIPSSPYRDGGPTFAGPRSEALARRLLGDTIRESLWRLAVALALVTGWLTAVTVYWIACG